MTFDHGLNARKGIWNMGLLIATVFAAIFAIAEARHHPSIELYEIRDQSETRSRNHEPVLQRINKLNSKTDAATLAKFISKYLALLNPAHSEPGDNSENEGGFVDETRSSIVVVPHDKETLYDIFKPANKANKNGKVYRLLRGETNDDTSYGKRTKRVAFERQWEIPMKSIRRKPKS